MFQPKPKQNSAANEIADVYKQWTARWEVQAIKRGSTDIGAALQAARAVTALSALTTRATARRRSGGAAPASVATACANALHGLLPPLLGSSNGQVVGTTLQGVAAIARAAPVAIGIEAAGPLLALLQRISDDGACL
jgi:hypothetical protein